MRNNATMSGLGLAIALLSATEARATPTLDEAVRFAQRELNRLCDDQDLSWFQTIDEKPVRRSCRATLSRGKLNLRVAYQHKTRSSEPVKTEPERLVSKMAAFRPEDAHAGNRRYEIEFDRHSMFVCGPPRNNGYAPLYLNCFGELSKSDKVCVGEELVVWTDDGQRLVAKKSRSFGLLFSMSPPDCKRLRNALNFVAQRSDRSRPKLVREYFSE